MELNGGGESMDSCVRMKKNKKLGRFLLGDKEIPNSHSMLSNWETAPRPKSWGLHAGDQR